MSKKRVANDLFMSWIQPAHHNRKVRRDLTKYLRNVPPKGLLLKWAEQQRLFRGPVLIIWAREDKLMPPAHAERLTEHFENSQLVWVDDSRTLIPIDQPTPSQFPSHDSPHRRGTLLVLSLRQSCLHQNP